MSWWMKRAKKLSVSDLKYLLGLKLIAFNELCKKKRQLGPLPVNSVIILTTISTFGNATLSIFHYPLSNTAVQIPTTTHFLAAILALSTSFLVLSVVSLLFPWSLVTLFSTTVERPKTTTKPPAWGPTDQFLAVSPLIIIPMIKSIEDFLNWLSSLLFWCFMWVQTIFDQQLSFLGSNVTTLQQLLDNNMKQSANGTLQVLFWATVFYARQNCCVFPD